jgi:hypothetical protein
MSDDDDLDPADLEGGDGVPDGAAVFPQIPAELNVNPLLLAVVHATVFLAGSDEEIVHPGAANETVEAIADYLRRLEGPALRAAREDMACLVAYARQQKWPKQDVLALKSFLSDLGIEDGDAA